MNILTRKDYMKNKTVFTKIKAITMATILSLSLGLSGCGDSDSKSKDESIRESIEEQTPSKGPSEEELSERMVNKGLDVLGLMLEKLHNENYLEIIGSSTMLETEAYKLLSEGDYTEPEKIYEITMTDELIALIFKEATSEGLSLDGMSEALQEDLRNRMVSTYMTVLNYRIGNSKAETVALLSYLSTGKAYVDADMKGCKKILIYVYKDACPLTVSFVGNDEGIVATSASAIVQKDFAAKDTDELRMTMASMFPDTEFLTGVALKIKQIK